MENRERCCPNCKAPDAGDFKKVVDLQYSGLVIYVHTKKDEQKKPSAYRYSKYDDSFILHNSGSKHLQRPEYVTELHRYKTKCEQCRTIVQRVRSLLDEIKVIRENEVVGVCEHCTRASLTKTSCKRCDFLVEKFVSINQKRCEDRKQRFKVWLCKVRHLLQAILDGETVCQHRVYRDTELDRFLRELKKSSSVRQPYRDFFPSESRQLMESKGMVEQLLSQIKTEGEKRLSSEDSLYPSPSNEICLCKYLKERNVEALNSLGTDKELTRSNIQPGHPSKRLPEEQSELLPKGLQRDKVHALSKRPQKDKLLGDKTQDSSISSPTGREASAQGLSKKSAHKDESHVTSKDKLKSPVRGLGTKAGRQELDKTPKKATPKGVSRYKKGYSSDEFDDTDKNKKKSKSKRTQKYTSGSESEHETKKKERKQKSPSKKSPGTLPKLGKFTFDISDTEFGDADSKKKKKKGKKGASFEDEAIRKPTKKGKNISPISGEPYESPRELSPEFLEKMLRDNAINLKSYQEYMIKLKAKQEEEERRRLKEKFAVDYSKANKAVTPPPTPEDLRSILECDDGRGVAPKYMIRGDKVVPYSPHYKDEMKHHGPTALFKTRLELQDIDPIIEPEGKYKDDIDYEAMFKDNVMRYKLSDKEFINKGWTKLPTEKIMRRMNIYKMKPVNPEIAWFERHRQDKELFYDSGEKLADIDEDGRGQWYYRNGAIALNYYNAEDSNIGQRYVVYSSGIERENGIIKPRTVLALFDVLGNGIVYDHCGKVRLKYNQSEGVLIDPKIGPPGRWMWHTLNEPPVLERVFIDPRMQPREPKLELIPIPEKIKNVSHHVNVPPKRSNPEMIAIELERYAKEKSTKLMQKFKPFQIRIKSVKLNEQFSLKIMDQTNIYLLFRDGATQLKLSLGLLLLNDQIIDTDTADMGDVATPYDRLPAKSKSLENIHKILKTVRSGKRAHSLPTPKDTS